MEAESKRILVEKEAADLQTKVDKLSGFLLEPSKDGAEVSRSRGSDPRSKTRLGL